MAESGDWIAEQKRVYFDNAGTVREFRTQLRGIKAPILLAGYVGLLVLVATVSYWGMSTFGARSVSSLQRELAGFYSAITVMLEFLVGLVAPVLAASSIIGEYQRQSIDLLFSSPMSPKYFLVGKVLASYRFVLLLLSLSIPISAMCVVMGGATWQDVLATYVLISIHGMIYMAISVPIAVMTARPVTTVVWSYLAGFAYFLTLSILGAASLFGPMRGSVPPFIGLSPFSSPQAGVMWTEVAGVPMPIWIPAAVIGLVFLRLMILGAASALTQAGSKETFNLRLTGVVLSFLMTLAIGLGTSGGARVPFGSGGRDLGYWVWSASIPMVIFLPYISTWAASGGAKAWPNGWWKPRLTLRGTPGGGLPYLLALLSSLTLGALVGTASAGLFQATSLIYLVGVFAMWMLAWSLGWAASSIVWRSGIESCRKLHVLAMFVVFVGPNLILGVLFAMSQAQGWPVRKDWTQIVNPFAFLGDNPNVAAVKVVIISGLAVVVWFFSERKRVDAVESMRSVA